MEKTIDGGLNNNLDKNKSKAMGRGLGKGLGALIQDTDIDGEDSGYLPNVPIDKIVSNPDQPRAHIKPDELVGLADSIREHGILEPLIVTKLDSEKQQELGADYRLIAGERRLRAAKLAYQETVPIIIKEASPRQVLEMAIIENIQRKDLNPIEEATALNELYRNHRVKLETLAKKIGRDPSTISNKMRLLKLPKRIIDGLLNEDIAESHAYQLLTLKSNDARLAAFNIIVRKGLTVAQTEELVGKIGLGKTNSDTSKSSKRTIETVMADEGTKTMEKDLLKKLGKGVKIKRKRKGGKITVPFATDDQLEQIYKYLMSKEFSASK